MPGFTDARPIPANKSLRYLGDVSFGRIVYHYRALPAIQPVNHIVDDGAIFIHADASRLALSAHRQAVAYQADTIDPHTLAGWSVTVIGFAEELTTPDTRTPLQHRLDSPHHHRVIRIRPDIIIGTEYGPQPRPGRRKPGPDTNDRNPPHA